MLLRRHNLNLLPILRELLRTRNVGQTAEIVGLSQSAVSAALAKLRRTYNDDLLVMVGRQLELTERGAQLIEPTERTCLEMEALLRPAEFDPSRETRRFVVATADYVAFLLAPEIARIIAQEAPLASVHFMDLPIDVSAQLARGKIDAVIIPEDTAEVLEDAPSSTALFTDELVVIGSQHRSFSGPLTREIYDASRHARFKMFPTSLNHQDFILRDLGIEEHDFLVVQQFLMLPAIVESSDCLALVYRRLAERFLGSHDIDIIPAPFDLSPISIAAYWNRLVDRDPAHVWFRNLLVDVSRDLDLEYPGARRNGGLRRLERPRPAANWSSAEPMSDPRETLALVGAEGRARRGDMHERSVAAAAPGPASGARQGLPGGGDRKLRIVTRR